MGQDVCHLFESKKGQDNLQEGVSLNFGHTKYTSGGYEMSFELKHLTDLFQLI